MGVRQAMANLIDAVLSHLSVEEPEEPPPARRPDMLESVERARQEWLAARAHFEMVTDPDLIDHAIYAMEAAQKKYMYLLKQAKEQGLAVEAMGPQSRWHEVMAAASAHRADELKNGRASVLAP